MTSEAVYQLPEPTPHSGTSKHPRIPVPLPIQTGNLDGSIAQVGSFCSRVCVRACMQCMSACHVWFVNAIIAVQAATLQDFNIVGLRALNRRHWKEVRKQWREASLGNQQRYAASLDILRGLYVPPEAPLNLEQQPTMT